MSNKSRGTSAFLLDWEKGPETKDLTPKQSPPVEKPSLGAGVEDLEGGNFWHVGHTVEPSDGPLDSSRVNKEKPLSPVTESEPKTLAQEGSLNSDEFERSSNLPEQSEGPLGMAPQEHAAPGACTSPPPIVSKPSLQETRINRCEFCQRTFCTQAARKRHEQIHTRKKSFKGKQCAEALCLLPGLTRRLGSPSDDESPGKSFTEHPSVPERIHSQEG